MKRVIFTKGLPASGKTTWAKQMCDAHPDEYMRVNRDDLRNMRGEYWLPTYEDMITKMELECIKAGLIAGLNVIVDATNLVPERVDRTYSDLIRSGFRVNKEYKDFTDVSVAECIARDKNRMRTQAYVGEEVIIRMAKKAGLISPPPEQRFLAGAKDCIICDIDGTLAHSKDRSFYEEGEKLLDDSVDFSVNFILKMYGLWSDEYDGFSRDIILLSGRKEAGRKYTEQWLKKNAIHYDMLLMRADDDNRKDSIVKRELYEKYIKGQYNVDFVLDDRDQVVKMWRNELGLKCLQVAEGSF